MSNSALLCVYWQRWEGNLKTIVKSRGAQLHFPAMQEKFNTRDEQSPDARVYHLSHPICILNAPQKASTTRHKKMHVLIDGTYQFGETAGHPCLTHASCNITLFRPEEKDDGTVKLVLTDALHFDVESPENGKRKGFHPFFHVQRGTSLTDEVVRQVISDAEGWNLDEIEVDQSARELIGHPYLRIPTPQLDLFAVLTMVVADCFCNPGIASAPANGSDSNAETLFAGLLRMLTETNNVVREGNTSQELRQRVQAGQLMSAAHWYPEWAGAAAA